MIKAQAMTRLPDPTTPLSVSEAAYAFDLLFDADLAEEEDDITCTHSIDAARENHTTKLNNYKTKPHYINARKNHSKKSNGAS